MILGCYISQTREQDSYIWVSSNASRKLPTFKECSLDARRYAQLSCSATSLSRGHMEIRIFPAESFASRARGVISNGDNLIFFVLCDY